MRLQSTNIYWNENQDSNNIDKVYDLEFLSPGIYFAGNFILLYYIMHAYNIYANMGWVYIP